MSISLELLFSSLWVTHPEGMGFDSIMIAPILLALRGFFFVLERGVSSFPSYQLSVASSLSLNVGYLLFGGEFRPPPVNGCSTAGCNVGALAGGDGRMSFYSLS